MRSLPRPNPRHYLPSRSLQALMLFGLLALLICFALPAPQHAQSSVPTLDSEEQYFLTLINNYRQSNGLQPLQVSISLTNASKWFSNDMASKNYFPSDHVDSLGRGPSQRMADFGYNYNTWWGENIAAGYSAAQDTFNQWKNSPAHNSNMLNANYKVIGIGRAYGASSTYRWYWTTDFGGYVDQVLGGPTPTPTVTPTPTPTPVPTPTPTPVPTPTPTPVPTPTPTPKPTPTPTPVPTPTPTPVPTPTPAPTDGTILNPSFELQGSAWTTSGAVSYVTGSVVTNGTYAVRLSPRGTMVPSVLQWVQLTPGATYEVSADIFADTRAKGTVGVKWDNYAEGPALSYVNNSANHKVTVRFTVPSGSGQVCIYFKGASISSMLNTWTTADNFKLVRVQ